MRDLDKRAKMEERLVELGRLHERHGVRRQFLDAMGPAFCQTIRPVLQAQGMWDQEVREAWLRLFRVISFHMKKG